MKPANCRKRYSKQREAALWKLVDHTITELRFRVLRGDFTSLSATAQETKIYSALNSLADEVARLYRMHGAQTTRGSNDQT